MPTLSNKDLKPLLGKLTRANLQFLKTYPGDTPDRQPVHTVYGGAHLFKSDTTTKLGRMALQALETNAPTAESFVRALGLEERLPIPLWTEWYGRIVQKLKTEAVEDFRIDFEDGFGVRPDAEEDATAEKAAREVALGLKNKTLSPFIGIRIKPFTEELRARSIRTLDLFLTTLLRETKALPPGFVVTLPKVQITEQVTAFISVLEILERKLKLKKGSIKMEFMIEVTQAILGADGFSPLPGFLAACKGRCVAAHFGTYDYTASYNITAQYQTMDHPACDFAHHMMKMAYAGTGIWLSDGATNVMPVGTRDVIHSAWKLAFDHTRHSLRKALYQGWDLHPAQLPVRYAAVYSFFLESLAPASERLKNFIDKSAQATLVGDVFDDAATGQGLLNYFLRALNCGAITEKEILATGLTLEEVRMRSFVKILKHRSNRK